VGSVKCGLKFKPAWAKCEISSQKYPEQKGLAIQPIECLPRKCKALSSNCSTAKKKKKRKKEKYSVHKY
jgi:hypothetical protein